MEWQCCRCSRKNKKKPITTVVGLCSYLQGECEELERQVDARCDALIRSIERRRQWLIDAVRQDKEIKQRSLKDHVTSCTCKLQKTTSLLQFCIEALKENDPVSFLQVSNRVFLIFSRAVGLGIFNLNRPVNFQNTILSPPPYKILTTM